MSVQEVVVHIRLDQHEAHWVHDNSWRCFMAILNDSWQLVVKKSDLINKIYLQNTILSLDHSHVLQHFCLSKKLRHNHFQIYTKYLSPLKYFLLNMLCKIVLRGKILKDNNLNYTSAIQDLKIN